MLPIMLCLNTVRHVDSTSVPRLSARRNLREVDEFRVTSEPAARTLDPGGQHRLGIARVAADAALQNLDDSSGILLGYGIFGGL